MDGLVHCAALEEVVALVGAAAGVEEREHSGDQQRGFVVRNGVGTREDRNGLSVFAVAVGEKERIDGREVFVQRAAFAGEAAFEKRAAVNAGSFCGDEIAGLDVDADISSGADRAVFQQGCSVDRRSFPDIDLPDETGAGDACVRTDGTEGVAAFCGVAFDHSFDGFDSLGAIAIDGQDVGGLGGESVVDPYGTSAVLVDGGDPDSVAERGFAAAFERRNPFDQRLFADAVVAYGAAAQPCSPPDLYASFEPTARKLGRGEVLCDFDDIPIFRAVSGGRERLDFGRCRFSVFRHVVVAIRNIEDKDRER